MKHTTKDLGNNTYEVKVTLTKEEWENAKNVAYNKTKSKYNVEGFRKGKAPRAVIEKTYGDTVFYDEALSQSFFDEYEKVLAEGKIQPVDSPALSIEKIDDEGVVMNAIVPIMPDIKLGAYTGFDMKMEVAPVEDKDVEHELKHAQERNVRLNEVERASKMGDVVNINFEGFIDDKAFEGGKGEAYDLELGSKSFIDNFEEQLVDKKAGDKVDVCVKFPEEYHVAELKGKPATFKVTVNTIKEKVMPELNDEFASNVSEFETMADYKADIKKNLEKMNEERAKVELENKIIDKIVENAEVSVPEILIHRELDEMMRDMSYKLMYQGITLEDYAKYIGKTVEQLKEERHADAEKAVKIRLAFTKIVELEKLSVTEEELNAKIEEVAKKMNKTVEEYNKTMTDERKSYLKNEILVNKLLDFLIAKNTK